VPAGLDAAEAATLILSWTTAYQLLHRAARAQRGQRMLVHGAAGAVDQALLALGRLAGLELWGTARGEHAALIRELGATPIDYQRVCCRAGSTSSSTASARTAIAARSRRSSAAACSAPRATRRVLASPKILESVGCHVGVPNGVLDVLVPEVVLEGARVVAVVGELEPTRMAKHVRVHREWHLGGLADALDEAVEADGADRPAAPGCRRDSPMHRSLRWTGCVSGLLRNSTQSAVTRKDRRHCSPRELA
jgi:hypothetical protein